MRKLIAIVAGGDSSEHQVSLRSAAGILSFMDAARYEAYIVELHNHQFTVYYGEERLPLKADTFSFTTPQGEERKFQFAYITVHGTPGEDGILQGFFDTIGLPYSTCNHVVEALTFNKFLLNQVMRTMPDLHVSESLMVRRGEPMPTPGNIVERLGLPLFIKPSAGGSSFGVSKVKTLEEVVPAFEKALEESPVVMAEALMQGTEVTCGAYRRGDEIVIFPITEVVAHRDFFDYEAKYNGASDEITPARISEEAARRVREMTRRIYEFFDCYGIIRIDYILTGSPEAPTLGFLEINTTPGMTPASFIPQQVRAAGLSLGDVLSDIIDARIK